MYLLLVDNSFISSREIKSLLDKNKIKCEIVNCSSSEALLDIAEKLSPDIVIIDFDFFIDDSADIVRELRKHSEEAYMLAFIDPDHYEKLYEAIEEGIDDYLVKPLQREDIMLRIKMGLQRKTMQIEKPAASVTQDQEIDRKLFLDIADAFGKQTKEVEKTYFSSEDMGSRPEQLEEADYSDLELISDEQDLPHREIPVAEDASADEPVTAETFNAPDDQDYQEDLFDLEPEPELETEPDQEESKLFVSEHEDIDDPDPEDANADSQYFDRLFSMPDVSETVGMEAKTEEPVLNETSLSDPEENRVAFSEESPGKIDDSELFGMKQKEDNVDTKSFEELFGSMNDPGTRKRKISSGMKGDKDKPGKVEYLFSAKKPSESEKDVGASEPESDIFLRDEEQLVKTPANDEEQDQKARGSRVTRYFGNTLTALLLIVMVTMSFYLIQSRIGGGTPAIAGYKMYVVLSGSMSPAFNTGSLVFVKPTDPSAIAVGDIITFGSTDDASRLTTHRVVGTNWDNGLSFITRGDANNVNDPNPVPAENLVGRVTGSIPYIGYMLGYAQTRQGLILLIFIPGFLILLFELRRLFGYLVESKVEKLAASVVPASASHRVSRHEVDTATGDFDFSDSSYRLRSR